MGWAEQILSLSLDLQGFHVGPVQERRCPDSACQDIHRFHSPLSCGGCHSKLSHSGHLRKEGKKFNSSFSKQKIFSGKNMTRKMFPENNTR